MAATRGSPVVPLVLLLSSLAGTALAQTGSVCAANKTNIEENSPIGSVVTTIHVDSGVTLILEKTDNSHLFEINGTELILKAHLDYEEVSPLITLELTCVQGNANVKLLIVLVEVVDLNDNIPVFAETSVSWTVREDIAVGSSIGTLSAKDADASDTVYYDLKGATAEGDSYFRLAGSTSSVIQVSRNLDYDKFSFAQLILYARDTAVPNASNHTATATINVTIVDVDNKIPWFIPCTFLDSAEKICLSDGYRVNVTRAANVTDALVLTPGPLYAVDGDKGINEAITYKLFSGNTGDIFSINNDTGNITMKKPSDVLGTTVLHIMASQVNNYMQYARTTVEINVVEKNNYPPRFPGTDYNGTIPAYSLLGSLVMEYNSPTLPLKMFAEDDDFPDKKNPSITYNIENSSEFIISQDGFIQSNAQLNSSGTIVAVVTATDGISGEKATTPVFVAITPLFVAETTTIASTTFTTSTATPGLTSSAQPPETVSGTTKLPLKTTVSSSSTGSRATGITNKPTSPSAQTAVTTNTMSGTPGKPATGNSMTTTSSVASVPSLNVTGPTTPSLTLGSTSTKEPFTGTTIASSRTTKITATPSHGPPDSNTTNGPQTGTGTTLSSTIRVTLPGSVGPPVSRNTISPQTRTGSTTRTTAVTVPIPVTPPGSVTTKPSTPRTGPTTSSITTTTPTGGGLPNTGSTVPPNPGTSPSGMITTVAHSKPPGSVTAAPSPTVSRPTIPDSTTRTSVSSPQAGLSASRLVCRTSWSMQRLLNGRSSIEQEYDTQDVMQVVGGPVQALHLKYSSEDMAAVGASLAAVLLVCIAFLGFLIHKQYGCNLKKLSEMDIHSGSGDSLEGNKTLIDNEYLDASTTDPNEAGDGGAGVNLNYSTAETTTDGSSVSGRMTKQATEDAQLTATVAAAFVAMDRPEGDVDSDKEVKSILTKERRVNDESYKAVWFKGDIEPDEVVMINEHEPSGEGEVDEDDDDDNDSEQDEEDNDDEEEEDNDGPDDEGRSDNQSPKVVFSTNNVPAETDPSAYTML